MSFSARSSCLRATGIILLFGLLAACGANPAERNNEGNRLSQNGDYAAAANAYQVAQVLAPDNAVIYFNSASALAASQDFAAAEAALQQAISRGEPLIAADAWYNLGNLYFSVGDIPNAISAYREALRRNPNHENARYNLELANAQAFIPTPTPIEMQQEQNNQQVNPTATPSPNPDGQVPPTPTPTPTPPDVVPMPGPSPENIGDDEEGDMNLEPQSSAVPRPEGDMDVETAIDMLEPIEASQERISTFRENYNQTGEQESEHDW